MTVTSYKSIILLPAKKVALYQSLDGLFPVHLPPGESREFDSRRVSSFFLVYASVSSPLTFGNGETRTGEARIVSLRAGVVMSEWTE